MAAELSIEEGRALAPLTTLELGGPADAFVRATDDAAVVAAFAWAKARGLPVTVLGGGSNVVVPDEGVRGLVVQMAQRGRRLAPDGAEVRLVAAAGEPWDALVAFAVEHALAGIECLAGIPGLAGATPIQNVGAYGQEVSDTLARVKVLDRRSLAITHLTAERCELAYRDSFLKRHPDRYVVLEIELRLVPGGRPTVRYAELGAAVGSGATLTEVREAVLRLRRAKSMVLDDADPNRRSAGSFFTNPIVDDADAERVIALAVSEGIVDDARAVPRYPAGPGRTKLAAGWLIEKAGVTKGLRRGPVGVSSAHALALVHHGGGTTAELLALAGEVRAHVLTRFGVELAMEPVLLGPRS